MNAVRALSVFALSVLMAGCPEASPTDAGPDAGAIDVGAIDVGGNDVGANDGGGDRDTGLLDAAPPDAAPPDAPADAGTDAGTDMGTDAGSANPCEAAGGACVALVPGACPAGIVGEPTHYSCGDGLGVECCLPISTPPFCDRLGTRSEGWVRPDGRPICFAMCAGATPSCENPGTRSEGWYSDLVTAGCASPPIERLIEWLDCTP